MQESRNQDAGFQEVIFTRANTPAEIRKAIVRFGVGVAANEVWQLTGKGREDLLSEEEMTELATMIALWVEDRTAVFSD